MFSFEFLRSKHVFSSVSSWNLTLTRQVTYIEIRPSKVSQDRILTIDLNSLAYG